MSQLNNVRIFGNFLHEKTHELDYPQMKQKRKFNLSKVIESERQILLDNGNVRTFLIFFLHFNFLNKSLS